MSPPRPGEAAGDDHPKRDPLKRAKAKIRNTCSSLHAKTPLATIILHNSLEKFTAQEQASFLFTLSRVLNIEPEEINILRVTLGSVRVAVEMKEEIMARLLSAYLESNPILRELSIERIQFEYTKPTPTMKPVSCFVKLAAPSSALFGRASELAVLEQGWEDQGINVIVVVAWGGVGKTALVNHWVNEMEGADYRGAERVYGWSFYSQGTKEDRQANSDAFLLHALEWFGDAETAKSGKSAWDKGVRLAELVRGGKTLLILDGVEPLQYPPGPMAGKLKDQGLGALLRELSHGMDGLCVITTREKIEDLEGQVDHTVRRVELENLKTEAGIKLLKH